MNRTKRIRCPFFSSRDHETYDQREDDLKVKKVRRSISRIIRRMSRRKKNKTKRRAKIRIRRMTRRSKVGRGSGGRIHNIDRGLYRGNIIIIIIRKKERKKERRKKTLK